jgi:hypothetical protein
MHELNERDREAILLRYFEGRAFAEVGAMCGVNENSARMRVERALEKLRRRLVRRGITSTAAALGAALASQPTMAAPAGLATTITGVALAGVAMGSGGTVTAAFGFLNIMSKMKLTFGAVGVIAAFLGGTYLGLRQEADRPLPPLPDMQKLSQTIAVLRAENRQLRSDVEQLKAERTTVRAVPPTPATVAATPKPNAPPATVLAVRQQTALFDNLRQISAARDQFILEKRRPPTSITELVGPQAYIGELKAVDGEDYSRLAFATGGIFSVTTAGGVTAAYDVDNKIIPGTVERLSPPSPPSPSPELEAAGQKALLAFRAAHDGKAPKKPAELLPYFENSKVAADFVDYIQAATGDDALSETKGR